MRGKTVDLNAINLVASEGARQSVDADVLRLDVAGRFIDLLIERGGFDFAASAVSGA
jgi:hypothetical protein